MKDFISVIITTRNRKYKAERAVKSVINQSISNYEIIVVDDCSKDQTSLYLKTKFPMIKIITNKVNLGGSASRNIGVKYSKGNYLSFLDDDDSYYPKKLEIQYNLCSSNKNLSLVTSRYNIISKDFERASNDYSKLVNKKLYFKNIYGGTSTYFTSKIYYDLVGGFDENLKSAQDWDFAYRMSKYGKIFQCKEVLVEFEDFKKNIRISNSTLRTYLGHRDIYLKYKNEMSDTNRKKLLFEILYYRMKLNKNKKMITIKILFKTDFFFFIRSFIKYNLL